MIRKRPQPGKQKYKKIENKDIKELNLEINKILLQSNVYNLSYKDLSQLKSLRSKLLLVYEEELEKIKEEKEDDLLADLMYQMLQIKEDDERFEDLFKKMTL